MTKQILDIELAGIDPDRPGGKRVAEAVGVDLAHPSPHPVTGEDDVHVMIAKRPAVKGLEEVACAPAPKVLQVGSEGFTLTRADVQAMMGWLGRFAIIPAQIQDGGSESDQAANSADQDRPGDLIHRPMLPNQPASRSRC